MIRHTSHLSSSFLYDIDPTVDCRVCPRRESFLDKRVESGLSVETGGGIRVEETDRVCPEGTNTSVTDRDRDTHGDRDV